MSKPKIAIIAHCCRSGGGLIGTLQILKAMFADKSAEYFLVYSTGYGYEEILEGSDCRSYGFDGPHTPHRRWYFETFALPKIIRKYGPDVVFGPGNIGLLHPPCPQALFIRNAYLYHGSDRYPQIDLRDKIRTWALRRQIRISLPSVKRVFVQTPVVQKRFCEYWNYPLEKTRIIRFPVPVDIKPEPDCPAPSPLEDCRDCFKVLFLTRYMAHRNPEILLLLCRRYQEQFRKAKIRFITTIDPKHEGRAKLFLQNIRGNHLNDIILNVGALSRKQVVQYYTHCDTLWLHTLIETLCLPFLESMRMGIPILAPDFDFARYVCGDAALYYDPWNIQSLYEKIICMKENVNIREQLVLKGYQQIKMPDKFSSDWKEAANDVLVNLKAIANK